jgi:hypothetical protein
MLENNIALVVGCMPAFAAFIRLHHSGSTFFKSLRSKVFGDWSTGKNSTPKVSSHTAEVLRGHGFKSDDQSNRPVHTYYYELNEAAPIMQVGVYAREHESNSQHRENQQAIFKSINISQESHSRSAV